MFKEDLIIVRHARSKFNMRESDDLDDKLTTFGLKQARNVGEFFAHGIDVSGFDFFTSPLLRCLQTSQSIVAQFETPPQPRILPQLREYLNHSGRAVTVPNRKVIYTDMNWDIYPDEGETYDEEFNETFLCRMHDAYLNLSNKSIVVTHGLPALTLMHIATETRTNSVPVWDHSIDNASITVIKKGRLVWRGRNLFHEEYYDNKIYHKDLTGVMR